MLEYKVRRVVESDRADILEMARKTWGGHDYMPAQLDGWIKSRKCRLVGIEVKGHLVGMANLHLIDSGRTGWMEGLRVHPRYRKKGLARVLTQALVTEGIKAGVDRLRYTTDATNSASISLAHGIGMDVRAKMGVFWKGSLKRVKRGGVKQPPMPVKPAAAKALLKDAGRLFSDGVIIHDWKAYDFNPEGIAQAVKQSEVFIDENEGKTASVTFGTVRNEGDESGWSITIYAESREAFLQALYSQILLAKEKLSPFVMGIYPTQFSDILLEQRWIPKWVQHFAILLFEKNLKQSGLI